MIGRIFTIPRATTVGMERDRGKDMAEIIVRAGSKTGAILTARLEAVKTIPLREQKVVYIEQLDTDRFFNKWRVEISDQESVSDLELN
jgi:hypothetical protein